VIAWLDVCFDSVQANAVKGEVQYQRNSVGHEALTLIANPNPKTQASIGEVAETDVAQVYCAHDVVFRHGA
jgi:hypothetical protein